VRKNIKIVLAMVVTAASCPLGALGGDASSTFSDIGFSFGQMSATAQSAIQEKVRSCYKALPPGSVGARTHAIYHKLSSDCFDWLSRLCAEKKKAIPTSLQELDALLDGSKRTERIVNWLREYYAVAKHYAGKTADFTSVHAGKAVDYGSKKVKDLADKQYWQEDWKKAAVQATAGVVATVVVVKSVSRMVLGLFGVRKRKKTD